MSFYDISQIPMQPYACLTAVSTAESKLDSSDQSGLTLTEHKKQEKREEKKWNILFCMF